MSAIPATQILPDLKSGQNKHEPPPRQGFEPSIVGGGLADFDNVPSDQASGEFDARSPEFAEGFAAGQHAAEQRSAELQNEQQVAVEQAVATARQTWSETEGQALAQSLTAAIEALREEVCSIVAETLEPVLRIEMHCRVVDDLTTTLNRLTASREMVNIEVRAPEDLLESVRNAIPSTTTNVTFARQSDGEIELRIDDTRLRTEIELWGASLAGAMR